MEQIQWGYATFGPRWSSLLNSDRRPLLLTKKLGDGEVLLAELGSCNILPKPGMTTGKTDEAPIYLRELAKNILRWGQASFGWKHAGRKTKVVCGGGMVTSLHSQPDSQFAIIEERI